MLVGVTYDEADGTARRLTLKHATQQLHLVRFLSRGGNLTLSWVTTVQLLLDKRQVDVYPRGHAVYHAADGLSVALAKRCQPEIMPETIHFSLFTS